MAYLAGGTFQFPGIAMPAALAGVSAVEAMVLPGLLKMVGYSDSDLGIVAQAHQDRIIGGSIYVFTIGLLTGFVNMYIPIY